MTQGKIERVDTRSTAPGVLEPDEVIEVEPRPVSTTRPDVRVRATEIVTRGLDLLTSLGQLALRFLQESDRTRESAPPVPARSGSALERADTDRGGHRRRRRRGRT
jgi:hypothetical protein